MSFLSDFLDSPEKLYSFIGAAAAITIPLIVNVCKDFYFDCLKRTTEKSYISVQLIFLLDEFASKCGDVSWDQGYDPSFPTPNEHEYNDQVEAPIFDMSSVKGEHKYLEASMLYKLQNINIEVFKSKVRLRDLVNSPSFDYSDLPGYYETRRREYANIGLYACNIADELRKNFDVPSHHDWNPRDSILDSIKQMNRCRSVRKLKGLERKARLIMQNAK